MTATARPNLLPTAAFVSLLVLVLGVTALFTLSLTHSRTLSALDRQTRLDEARGEALETKVEFKTQVQEWKNVLLRGAQPADFDRHLASFEKHEAAVQTGLASVKTKLDSLRLPEDGLASLSAAHLALGSDYRAALATWKRDDPSGAFAVDKAVRGRDRQLGDDIDKLAAYVSEIAAREHRASIEASVSLYASLRKAVLIIGALAVIASLWLAFASSRASRA